MVMRMVVIVNVGLRIVMVMNVGVDMGVYLPVDAY